MPDARAGTQGAAIGTRLYVPGGARELVFEPTRLAVRVHAARHPRRSQLGPHTFVPMRAANRSALSLGRVARHSRADAFCGFYVGGAGAEDVQQRDRGRADAPRHDDRAVDAEQLPGPAARTSRWSCRCRSSSRRSRSRRCRASVFDKIDTLGAPRLVEYWEQDPCTAALRRATMTTRWRRRGRRDAERRRRRRATKYQRQDRGEVLGRRVRHRRAVGAGLDRPRRWLRANKYKIPTGAEPLLRPYVEQGTKFFVAKVDPKKVKFENGMATLSPLRFHYDSPEFNAADPARARELGRHAGSDRQHPRAEHALRGRELPERHDPDEPRRQGRGARRGSASSTRRCSITRSSEKPGAVVTEYAWDSRQLRSVPGPDARRQRPRDARRRRRSVDLQGRRRVRAHADAPARALRQGRRRTISCSAPSSRSSAAAASPTRRASMRRERRTSDGTNNFQGRYVILHPWTGAIACANPVRGKWGGPNGQRSRSRRRRRTSRSSRAARSSALVRRR